MTLTDKQSRFIDSYLAQGNKLEAALFAGYSTKSASAISSQLLKKPAVIAKITEIKTKLALNPPKTRIGEFSKDDFVNYALDDYQQLDITEPNKPRFLQLAGQAKGFIGTANDQRPNQTLNVQINMNGQEQAPELWAMTRKLLSES